MATSRRLGPEVSVTQGHLLQSEQEGSLGYLLECNYPADHQAKKKKMQEAQNRPACQKTFGQENRMVSEWCDVSFYLPA